MKQAVSVILMILLGFGVNLSNAATTKPRSSSAKSQAKRITKSKPIPVSYQARLLMEADTGQILFEDNAHKPWPPASMVKMMLALIVAEKLQEGGVKLTDVVAVSKLASSMGGSQVYLKPGEVFTLEELMRAALIASANDASVAVAEHVAGSADGFVELMNARAKALNMNNTRYANVHGLPPGRGQQGNVSSAYDSAILARELLKHPGILQWTSAKQAYFRNNTLLMSNTNHLLRTFPDADGLKTGFYSAAGFNVTATAKRDNMRLIVVVMGVPSSKARFQEAARLLSLGFDTYQKLTVLRKDQPLDKPIPVRDGKNQSIQPVVADDVVVVIKKGEESHITLHPHPVDRVEAPIDRGQTLGHMSVMLSAQPLATTRLISPQSVPKLSWLERLKLKSLSALQGKSPYLSEE